MVAEVANVIRRLKQEGAAILLIEQNPAFAVKVADYTHVMSKGVTVHASTPSRCGVTDQGPVSRSAQGAEHANGAKIANRRDRWGAESAEAPPRARRHGDTEDLSPMEPTPWLRASVARACEGG